VKNFEINLKEPPKDSDRVLRTVPESSLRNFGLNTKAPIIVKKLEDLRNNPPNIVIALCLRTTGFIQNKFKNQVMHKKQRYVMGLGVYKQLWYDTSRNIKLLKPATVKFNRVYKPYIGQDLDDKTLLVTRTGGIGDLLFIQPNLKYLKEKYPTCKIIFACGPQYQAMVEDWDCIDTILDLPFNFNQLVEADYHALFEGVIERCEEAANTNAYRLFTTWLGINLPDELLVPHQPVKDIRLEFCKKFLSDNNITDPFILLQIRSSSPIRTPSLQFWKKVIEIIVDKGHTVIITDSPHKHVEIDAFIRTLDPEIQDKVINFTKESQAIDYTIALTSLAGCILSPDSSLIHLAAAVGKPGVGIYGAFPGEIRLSTYSNIDWIMATKDCSPCFLHGSQPCKFTVNGTHPLCYETIDVNEVVKKITEKLNG
jgi:ADP-heptose:LPS heptosyltransferase